MFREESFPRKLVDSCRGGKPKEENKCPGGSLTCPNKGGGFGNGHPQCLTYDGLRFECNFLGEAVWTKCDDFAVHVFTAMPNSKSRGTVIKGIAVTEGGEVVHAVLREGATRDASFDFGFDGDEEKLQGNHLSLTLDGDKTLLVQTALGHQLTAVFEPTHVSLEIILDKSCFSRSEGLMGNNNGNAEDDLRPFNSTKVMATKSPVEEIYEEFVLSWCTDDIKDSLFPLELFNPCDRSYWPMFTSDLDMDECPASCQGDRFCCLDISEAGEELALSTLPAVQNTIGVQTLARAFLERDPPELSLPTEILLQPGSSTQQFTVFAEGSNIETLNCSVCSLEGVLCNLRIETGKSSASSTSLPQNSGNASNPSTSIASLDITGESSRLLDARTMTCVVEANGTSVIGGGASVDVKGGPQQLEVLLKGDHIVDIERYS